MKYILYARKSSESEERQVQSIEDQINYWNSRLSADASIEIVKVYTEEKSAKTPYARPEFQKMVVEIEKGGIDGILCWKLDRLTRNPVDTGTIQYMLQRGKLSKIITSDREYHPVDAGLLFSVETGMANQFILDLSKNTKRGLQGKVDRGGFTARAPQGYLNDRLEKTVVPDPDRFHLVRKMWDMMLAGAHSPAQIADIANENWGYRTTKSRKQGGCKLSASVLYHMFHNPFYAGSILYKWSLFPGNHEAMITSDEFAQVQRMFGWEGPVVESRPKVHSFAFTGCIACAECGCAITGETKYKKLKDGSTKSYTYYHCTHRKDSGGFRCSQRKNVEEKNLERQITKILSNISIRPEFLEWAKSVLKRRHNEETEARSSIFLNLNKSIEDETRKRDRLLELYLGGSIEKEDFDTKKQQIEAELKQLQLKRNGTEERAKNWVALMEKTFDFAAHAKARFESGDIETRKTIFLSLGSNLRLEGGKLHLDLESCFVPFEQFNKGALAAELPLEPRRKGSMKRIIEPSCEAIHTWQPQ